MTRTVRTVPGGGVPAQPASCAPRRRLKSRLPTHSTRAGGIRANGSSRPPDSSSNAPGGGALPLPLRALLSPLLATEALLRTLAKRSETRSFEGQGGGFPW